MRKKLTLRVDSDLVQQAKALGINLSRLTEKAIVASIGNRTYMHVQNDISRMVHIEMQPTQNESKSVNELDNESGWRVGRNPPSVLGDIHLIGIPAPPAGGHWRLLSLSRRGRAFHPYLQPHQRKRIIFRG